jgi:hypothetical protein
VKETPAEDLTGKNIGADQGGSSHMIGGLESAKRLFDRRRGNVRYVYVVQVGEVFGYQIHESLTRAGETMTTTAEVVTYAYHQMDQARAELEVCLGIERHNRHRDTAAHRAANKR